jgi:hypothetical protein
MNKLYLLAIILIGACDAFVGQTVTKGRSSLDNPSRLMASYEVDSDEDAEQRLGEGAMLNENPFAAVMENAYVNGNADAGRYGDVLASVGLQGKLKHTDKLPKDRVVSSYDIFCNRELKQDAIAAIGFDMVCVESSFTSFNPFLSCYLSSHFLFRTIPLCSISNLHSINWHSMVQKRSSQKISDFQRRS